MIKQMKESGIEWIGDIPENWGVCKMKYLLEEPMKYGANESGISHDPALPRYIRITDILENNELTTKNAQSLSEEIAENYLLKKNDLLFARSGGTVGKTYLVDDNTPRSAFAGYLIKASFNEKVNAKFVYYFTLSKSYIEWKNSITIQATIQNIGADKYSNIILPLPSKDEQVAITKFLDEKIPQINSILKETRESIEELKNYKQSLITETVIIGLNKDVEMKKSGVEWINEIPFHWNINKAKRVFKRLKRPVISTEIVTAFRDGEVTRRSKRRTEGFTIAEKEHGYQGVEIGDLVIHGMDAFAGAIGVSDSSGKCSPVYLVCTPVVETESRYYAYLLKTYARIGYIESLARGIRERSTDFRYATFSETPLISPPIEEQREIVRFLDEKCAHIDSLIEQKQQLLVELEAYKKSFIYEYVTGKKEVL